MNKIYKKKFSIGLSLAIELDEYKKIIDEFGDYICSIYFSPPLGAQYHSRPSIAEQLAHYDNIEKLFKIIELFKINGINIDADINVHPLSMSDIDRFIEFVKNNEVIDEVTAVEPYGKKIHDALPDLNMLYSFNNFWDGGDIPNYYSTVVIGRRYLKDFNVINKLISKNIKVKLLINNGCSFNCGTCRKGSEQCFSTVEKNLSIESINQLYAKQTLFPWEVYELIKRIHNKEDIVFKISNRTSGFSYLYKCLKSYTGYQTVHPYIDEGVHNYGLFCRMGPMEKHFCELDYYEIEKEKMDFWRKSI